MNTVEKAAREYAVQFCDNELSSRETILITRKDLERAHLAGAKWNKEQMLADAAKGFNEYWDKNSTDNGYGIQLACFSYEQLWTAARLSMRSLIKCDFNVAHDQRIAERLRQKWFKEEKWEA